jgi:hypothetical protein
VKEAALKSKKRPLEVDGVDQPRKTVRTNASRRRTADGSHASSTDPDYEMVEHSATIISEEEELSNVVRRAGNLQVSISHSGRSGRAVRLPTRFR